jgi:hypothetical protein
MQQAFQPEPSSDSFAAAAVKLADLPSSGLFFPSNDFPWQE